MRKTLVTALTAVLLVPTAAAFADEKPVTEKPVENLQSVEGLSDEQRAAVSSFTKGGEESAPAVVTEEPAEGAAESADGNQAAAKAPARPLAVRHARATYYRGSALMWTRDSVDFSYNGRRIIKSNPYQQAGAIFPNIARNLGISKYYGTSKQQRFRARNRIGAGVPSPWGHVTVYTADFVHRLEIHANGRWRAWAG